ncbi:PBECR4 domain-containing protein [Lactococcus lactis]|uniref:PBECR4 domain-containing protein n=1 Tax=Lactococcus lactis TaxID=1358 RepID=UPI00207882EA|nr:PBECR4 domain-containing protein [Lactococcus lactis]MDM7655966.1 PBECR4 domain-containing protein [Lactococcus lactis]MDY5176405.1 PBECR4 domain-containing protein [Lactococcus lactis]USI62124.1 PBECR4 domain-containing protein [Lactococcus lactis subsp. lactis]UXD81505.1 hypothetical protein D4840_027 [Lactococcus phage D4840]
MKSNSGFKKPSNSEFIILQKELPMIKSVLSFIDYELLGKDIIICTAEKEVAFKIEKRNIPHLLGISYNGGGKSLWRDFKKKRLSTNNMSIKEDGTTFQKLAALHCFNDLFLKSCFLTGNGKYEKLTFDASIRTGRLLLAIGLKYSDNDQIYYPNTALNLRSKIIPNGEKVLAIYTENSETGELKYLQRNPKFMIKKY